MILEVLEVLDQVQDLQDQEQDLQDHLQDLQGHLQDHLQVLIKSFQNVPFEPKTFKWP